MKTVVHRADSRGFANHGWLKSHHTFSFAGYFNPERNRFGLLRVLNDDVVKGGGGFGEHPHDNMEIVSIPLEGALQHRDSTGRSEVIRPGEVQIMSAGSGLRHSEFNASQTEPVNFLQIWVFPKERNIKPRYDQKIFRSEDRKTRFQPVVSPEKEEGALWINQQAAFHLADPDADTTLRYAVRWEANGIYLFVIDGQVEVGGEKLGKRDAIGIWDTDQVEVKANTDAKLLLIEVPMN